MRLGVKILREIKGIAKKAEDCVRAYLWPFMWLICLISLIVMCAAIAVPRWLSASCFGAENRIETGAAALQNDGEDIGQTDTVDAAGLSQEAEPDLEEAEPDPRWSDFRTVLIPIIVSVVITLLGCLITTYIFLKEALDRVGDQKPYAVEVIGSYRKKTIHRLLGLFGFTILFTALTAALYFWLWDEADPWAFAGHFAWLIAAAAICILSGLFLEGCMDTEKVLLAQAYKIEKKIKDEIGNLVKGEKYKEFVRAEGMNADASVPQGEKSGFSLDDQRRKKLLKELELAGEKGDGIQQKSFLFHFSALEEWLKLLANTFSDQKEDGTFGMKLIHALNHAEALNKEVLEKYSRADLAENEFSCQISEKLEEEKKKLEGIESQSIYEVYTLLSRYRDVLRFVYENTMEGFPKEKETGDQEKEDQVLGAYYLLHKSCYLLYLRVIPKITVMQPMENLEEIDFYGCRVEDSSFRGGVFSKAMFARVKVVNTNFDMAKFQEVSFFNGDVRNCAMSNCAFQEVDFRRAGFEDTDFNYSSFRLCNFSSASLRNSRFSNNLIEYAALDDTDFSYSQMWDVSFSHLAKDEMRDCIFTEADIKGWEIASHKNKNRYGEKIGTTKKDASCREESQVIEWLGKVSQALFLSDQGFHVSKSELSGSPNEILKFHKESIKYMCPYFRWREQNQTEYQADAEDIWQKIDGLMLFDIYNSVFNGARIRDCAFFLTSFVQGLFIGAQMERFQALFLDMKGCVAAGANLKESCLIGVDLRQSNLEEVNLYQAKLSGVNLEDVNLAKAQISQSHISACTFDRSVCSGVSLTRADVQDSSFCDAALGRAEFTASRFSRVALRRAALDGLVSPYSVFVDCDFSDADLTGANLNFCVFQNCRFNGAALEDVSAIGASFEGCGFDAAFARKKGGQC